MGDSKLLHPTNLHFVYICFPMRSGERDHLWAHLQSAGPWSRQTDIPDLMDCASWDRKNWKYVNLCTLYFTLILLLFFKVFQILCTCRGCCRISDWVWLQMGGNTVKFTHQSVFTCFKEYDCMCEKKKNIYSSRGSCCDVTWLRMTSYRSATLKRWTDILNTYNICIFTVAKEYSLLLMHILTKI